MRNWRSGLSTLKDWSTFSLLMATQMTTKRSNSTLVHGPTAYKLLRSLVSPQKPGDKTYRELVDIMKKHHNPTPSEMVESNSRCRKSEESIAQYVAALRSLAEFCNFEDSLSKMLKDRLVIGVQDSHIQRRLLAEKALSFDKAFELAQSLEQASESAIVIQNGRGATAQDEVVHKIKGTQVTARRPSYKPESRDPVPPCYRCVKSNHTQGCASSGQWMRQDRPY